MTMPLPIMDHATLVAEVVKLVISRTQVPHQAVGILCAAVAMVWLATDKDEPNDEAMVAEFAHNLSDAVAMMRADLDASGVLH